MTSSRQNCALGELIQVPHSRLSMIPHLLGAISGIDQSAFICTIEGPVTSYSSFVIHISCDVLRDDQIEPPIHTEYFRSGGAVIVTCMAFGTRALSSFSMRASIPR